MAKNKYIESPEVLWQFFLDYKKSIKDFPKLVQDYVGKDADMVYREKERPLTDKGFFNYCRREVGCVKQYFDNPDNRYSEYITICRVIKDEIDEDQIEGGMTNIFNPSITQRLQGLVDKKEVTDIKPQKLVIKVKRNEDN